jgi:hypothetical protein
MRHEMQQEFCAQLAGASFFFCAVWSIQHSPMPGPLLGCAVGVAGRLCFVSSRAKTSSLPLTGAGVCCAHTSWMFAEGCLWCAVLLLCLCSGHQEPEQGPEGERANLPLERALEPELSSSSRSAAVHSFVSSLTCSCCVQLVMWGFCCQWHLPV